MKQVKTYIYATLLAITMAAFSPVAIGVAHADYYSDLGGGYDYSGYSADITPTYDYSGYAVPGGDSTYVTPTYSDSATQAALNYDYSGYSVSGGDSTGTCCGFDAPNYDYSAYTVSGADSAGTCCGYTTVNTPSTVDYAPSMTGAYTYPTTYSYPTYSYDAYSYPASYGYAAYSYPVSSYSYPTYSYPVSTYTPPSNTYAPTTITNNGNSCTATNTCNYTYNGGNYNSTYTYNSNTTNTTPSYTAPTYYPVYTPNYNYYTPTYSYGSYYTPTYYGTPTCSIWITANTTGTNYGSTPSVELSWTSSGANGGTITTLGTVPASGTRLVSAYPSITYTGIFTGPGGSVTCSTGNTQAPYVTLSQVPYTGLDLGPVGTALYWGFLVLWCALAAYAIAVKKIHRRLTRSLHLAFFGDGRATHPVYAPPSATSADTATEVHAPAHGDEFIKSQISRFTS